MSARSLCYTALLITGVASLSASVTSIVETLPKVHAFYYLWYGNPETDGDYQHWNHEVLPHWTAEVNKNVPNGSRYSPPKILHSPFYPAIGPYSSRDPAALDTHFGDMNKYGIDVAVVSWWGRPDHPGTTDTQGVCTDDKIDAVLKAAEKANVKVAWHLEPYPGRDARSVRDDIAYINLKYGSSPAALKLGPQRNKMLYYCYDSYHLGQDDWASLLSPGGVRTVRGTAEDGVFIGLWLEKHHGREIQQGGFDGSYSYFASLGFSYGSTVSNWAAMSKWSSENDQIFIPSVGPGYDDSRIRPWNRAHKQRRDGGAYYDAMWRYATESKAPVISITSYNEWGEGTQIEPALSTEAAAAVKTVKNAVPVVSASKIAGGFAAAAAGTSAEGGGAGGSGANAVAVGNTEKKRGEIALTKAELQKMKVNEYTDYTQNGGEEYEPEYYLQKTLWWAMKFTGGTSSAMGSSHAGV